MPAFVVGEGDCTGTAIGCRPATPTEHDQTAKLIGPNLAEIYWRTQKHAGIEDVRRATPGVTAVDVPRAGVNDQTSPIRDRHVAQPRLRRRSSLRDVQRDLELVPSRFLVGEMHGPADLGIIGSKLGNRLACRVQPVDAKSCSLAFQPTGLIAIEAWRFWRRVRHLRRQKICVLTVAEPRYADRRIDRRPHNHRIAGTTLHIMSLAHGPLPLLQFTPVGVPLIVIQNTTSLFGEISLGAELDRAGFTCGAEGQLTRPAPRGSAAPSLRS